MRKRAPILVLACAVLLPPLFALADAQGEGDGSRQVGVVRALFSRVPNADKNWLVAVGINKYDEERVNTLRYCKADAQAVYDFFTESGVAPKSNAYLLVTDSADPKFQPTRLNILESIQYAAEQAGPDSTIVLFVAGHGFMDTEGKSYLLPQDGKVSLLRDTGVSVERINEMLRESRCERKVVFMDACRNAAMRDGRGGGENISAKFLETLKASTGQVTLAACGAGQTSFEDSESGHGVFTLHLLAGLGGKAGADRNGLINVSTLQDYLADAVPAWCSKHRRPAQKPWMWGEMSAPIPLAVAGAAPVAVTREIAAASAQPSDKSRLESLSVIILPSVVLLVVSIAMQVYFHRRSRKEAAVAAAKASAVPEARAAVPEAKAAILEPVQAPTIATRAETAPPVEKQPEAVGARAEAVPSVEQKPEAAATRVEAAPAAGAEMEGAGAATAAFSIMLKKRLSGDPLPEGMTRARLVFQGAEAGRKTLLLTMPRLAVGLDKFTRNPNVDLTLRFLPCRSKEQDSENWDRNLLISSPHFTIEAREDRFMIRDEIESKNGTTLVELKGGDDDVAESVSDADTAFETPSIMESLSKVTLGGGLPEEGKTSALPKGKWTPLKERCAILIGRRVMVLHAQTFTSSHWNLYALRLKRAENCPTLEYIQLIHRAYIGSDPNCPIRVCDPSFPRLAAAIDFTKGHYFLASGQAEIRVLLNGAELTKSWKAPLTHASLIEIGDYRWRFEPASIDDFTEVG